MKFLQLWDIIIKVLLPYMYWTLRPHVSDLHSCLLCEMGLNIIPILTLSKFWPVKRSELAFERYQASLNLGFWGQILLMHYLYFWSLVSLWMYGLAIDQASSKKCFRIYKNFE